MLHSRHLFALLLCAAPMAVRAQNAPVRNPRADSLRDANALDSRGETKVARELFAALVLSAPDPAAKAAAQRAMAISYAFDSDCANAVKLEEQVIAYWVTREQAEPQNAFYQQGEMANEAARVCIDAGDIATAEKWYKRGTELGNKEPEPRTHPKSLWDYRLAHALARIAARKNDKATAAKHVAEAQKALESDPKMADAQARFFPYLEGYVAYYTGDYRAADAAFTKTLGIAANQADPFFHALMAMTQEKLGDPTKARPHWQHAYDLANAHTPPSAHVRPLARKKLGM